MIIQFLVEENLWALAQAGAGGFMLNMMNLYEDSRRPKSRRVTKDIWYWIFFVFWPVAGAILASIYIASGYRINGLLAFTTGLTAPTLLQSMMEKAARPDRPPIGVEE